MGPYFISLGHGPSRDRGLPFLFCSFQKRSNYLDAMSRIEYDPVELLKAVKKRLINIRNTS